MAIEASGGAKKASDWAEENTSLEGIEKLLKTFKFAAVVSE